MVNFVFIKSIVLIVCFMYVLWFALHFIRFITDKSRTPESLNGRKVLIGTIALIVAVETISNLLF